MGFFFGGSMARIRTIKPTFWSDFKMSQELSRDQRLFYIGLWNEADDKGRFQAHPTRLKGVVFPYDSDIKVPFVKATLKELSETGRVTLYAVEGEPYGELTHFLKHQKINRPTGSRIPPPPNKLEGITEPSLSPHGGVTDGSRGEGRGEEEEEEESLEMKVFDYWRERRAVALGINGGPPMTPTAKRISKIRGRLKEGYSVEALRNAVDGCMTNKLNIEGGFVDIELICRDQQHVEQYLTWFRKDQPRQEQRLTPKDIENW